MDNTFTYVIRSKDKESTTENTNNCSIKLQGLPQKYKHFDCTVSALHISTISGTFSTSTFELRADVLDIVNGRDTNNYALRSVGFASYNNTYPQGPYTFRCSNFNNRSVRFQLYDDTNNLLKYQNNSFAFNGTFTYVSPAQSQVTVNMTSFPSLQLTVGQVLYNKAIGTIGTITAQLSPNAYYIATTLVLSQSNIPMIANASIIDYDKSWILVLNMVGIPE